MARAGGIFVSASDHAMTSQNNKKLSKPGLDFLALVLQNSISSDLIDIFQVLSSSILTVYKGNFKLVVLGVLVPRWCLLKGREY